MSKILTSEKLLSKKFSEVKGSLSILDMQELMIEFAKLHVKESLKKADENAKVTIVDYEHDLMERTPPTPVYGVDSDSILNAYPENLIK